MRTKQNQIALLIAQGRRVVEAMSAAPWFPGPAPAVAAVSADLAASRAAVEASLASAAACVEAIAAEGLAPATATVASACMAHPRRAPRVGPPRLVAVAAGPGRVALRASGADGGAAYTSRRSCDDDKAWTDAGSARPEETESPASTGRSSE